MKENEIIAKAIEEMQLSLEPIRDKAMDQRARWVGFVECAELMLKAMANKAAAVRLGTQESEKSQKEENQEEGAVMTSQKSSEVSGEIDNGDKWLKTIQNNEE